MRTITKEITLPVEGTPHTFRLTKLDAFSGAELLRLLSRNLPPASTESAPSGTADKPGSSAPSGIPNEPSLLEHVFLSMTPADLRSVMTSCLNSAEILLPAGWQPIMTGSEWGYPELSHDAKTCLRLTLETALWTLQGFFGESGSASGAAQPKTETVKP